MQYNKARLELMYQIQDVMDEKSPPVESLSGSSKIDSDDEELPAHQNMNYNKAQAELIMFEGYKKKKYQPIIIKANSKVLAGAEKEVRVGPPGKRGKILPLGRT